MRHSCKTQCFHPSGQLQWDVFPSSCCGDTQVPLGTSTLPSHSHGPTWDQSTDGRVGLPSFAPSAVPSTSPEKRGFDESHFRRKSLGLGAGSAACHVAHPPGICLVVRSCPVSISQPQAATLSQHVLETQGTSQGFPSAWHGHSAVAKPSPKQWPVMISCAVSLCTLGMGQCPHVPIPAGVCQLPFIPG